MAIGQSRLHEMLRRNLLFSESVVWLQAFTPQTKREILDMIQKDQLTDKGIDADGNVIGYYSYVTELITRGAKRQGDHYTLDDTGAFYRSMFVTVLKEAIEIDANADKGDENLFEKYSTKIIGLTDENLGKLIELVKKEYIKQAREILFRVR
jgi:hypothetical protein